MLKLMYITNSPDIARIAEHYGVDRIWIDLETLGKEERQPGNTVKSNHTIDDIRKVKPVLNNSELLVRVNPWNENSEEEIEAVIEAGADIIMLPMWRDTDTVRKFLQTINGRCKTTLLLETKDAENCLDEVLKQGGFDEIHIGLNDLHIEYGMTFMFELLANGVVDRIIDKIKKYDLPYGFGGVGKIGDGLLKADNIVAEHYRLGSTRVILSRAFCNASEIKDLSEVEDIFKKNICNLRNYEMEMLGKDKAFFEQNKLEIKKSVDIIIQAMNERK
ncbi:MAG: aldolase [Butyrivibrio sp.]|nr:aldolase [Butyrivibrio sp.]